MATPTANRERERLLQLAKATIQTFYANPDYQKLMFGRTKNADHCPTRPNNL